MRGKDAMSASWARSALSWWQDAGVDTIVGEEPRDWLSPLAAAAAPSAKAAPRIEPLPASLAGFQLWLAESDQPPFPARPCPRLAPGGNPASGLMMLTDLPSADDLATGTAISGEAGLLFDRMLAAMGRSRESIYLAALSPVAQPAGRLTGEQAGAWAEVARHHIGLVAPRALLLFGDAASKALIGLAMTAARGRWHEIDTTAGKIRTLVTLRPQELLNHPAMKAHAWDDLKLLMEELGP